MVRPEGNEPTRPCRVPPPEDPSKPAPGREEERRIELTDCLDHSHRRTAIGAILATLSREPKTPIIPHSQPEKARRCRGGVDDQRGGAPKAQESIRRDGANVLEEGRLR
ncbi:ribosomal protein S12/S23 family protein [Striga asiatica]|uniref:Ribosomal protein S12/S23 family protein n=1 Tax=Striga asiatica TaxID=4170 RepID=A0A5A7NYV6_STRAF|nr:ribosomal protein S12/S23 family protein [Striga asiatica]